MKLNLVERSDHEQDDERSGDVVLVVRGRGADLEIRVAAAAAGGLAAVLRVVADALDRREVAEAEGEPPTRDRRVRLIVREAVLDGERLDGTLDRAELEDLCHDLRTPINALVGYASLLDERVYGELSGEQAEAVRRIRSASDRLLGALRHLADRARIDLGDFYPRPPNRATDGFDERRRPTLRSHEG